MTLPNSLTWKACRSDDGLEKTQTSFRIPSDLLKEVKVRCALEETKLNDYVLGLIEKDMKKWKTKNPKVPI